MRIPDDLRECVCFVKTYPDNKTGSAFLVSVPLGEPGQPGADCVAVYVVTARHCISDPVTGPAKRIELLVNSDSGGIEPINANFETWRLHEHADVAVHRIRFGLDTSRIKAKFYPVTNCADQKYVTAEQVGAGDDVYIIGQLVSYPSAQIMPIARVGSIAAIPDGVVKLQTGWDTVTLLEVRSIGGLSGAPVFLHLPFWRDTPAGQFYMGTGTKAASGGTHRLLGIIHGFYSIDLNDPNGINTDEKLNTGIAVITRVDRMLDLINSPEEVQEREAIKRALVEDETHVTASAGTTSGG